MGRIDRQEIGLPPRLFMYTIDQLSMILSLSESDIRTKYLHFSGRSPGGRPLGRMEARNIAPEGDHPQWRVTETELIRWMKFKGFRIYLRGWASR